MRLLCQLMRFEQTLHTNTATPPLWNLSTRWHQRSFFQHKRHLPSGKTPFSYIHIFIRKWAAHRPPNMISISKSSLKVHSQYLQYLCPFLMEHPILKILGWLAIIKLQKRSESNVLTNFSSYRNRRLSKWWNPTPSWSNPWSLEWLANRSRVISLRTGMVRFFIGMHRYTPAISPRTDPCGIRRKPHDAPEWPEAGGVCRRAQRTCPW